MPRYEFVKGSSSKFWEIELSGKSFTTIYGKIGTEGKSTTKDFADAAAAKKKYESVIKSKVKKGYALVGDVAPEVDAEEASLAPENKELEAAIFENRDDDGAWQVFGDWLSAQGDPRGEAIALSFNNDGGKLKKLMAKYEQSWLGDVYESFDASRKMKQRHFQPPTIIEWKHGFMHHARLADHYDEEGNCEDKLKKFLALPASRFLHSLTIGIYYAEDENHYGDLSAILKKASLPGLRHLFVGDFVYPDETEMSWSELGGVTDFLKAFPKLESLRCRSGSIGAKSLDHKELRSLTLESGGIGPAMTKLVGKAKLPKLENLELWIGTEEWGGYGPFSDYTPLLAGKSCPNLKHLRFRNAEQADDLVEVIAKSKILPQLETVDLSKGMFTPRGARLLIEHKDAFAHLQTLDLSECLLGADVIKDLKKKVKVAGKLELGDQRESITYEAFDELLALTKEESFSLREAFYENNIYSYTAVGE